jgi:hypothetical protein
MEPYKSAIERAFELAQMGRCLDLSEIKDRLRNEGYFTESVTGPILCGQLKRLIEGAQKSRWAATSRIAIDRAASAKATREKSRRRAATAHA